MEKMSILRMINIIKCPNGYIEADELLIRFGYTKIMEEKLRR